VREVDEMAPQSQTVTEVLAAYRDGTTTREQMLEAMRSYPWKRPESSNPDARFFSETAWENLDYPQIGTVEEIYAAKARGVINLEDELAITRAISSRDHASR
jgi:hypothetical protein